MTSEIVLDASAILAVAKKEPGAERVLEVRNHAIVSSVNAAEVYAKLLAGGMPEGDVTDGLRTLVRRVVPFDEAQARSTASIHALTRQRGLSLADCACLALGRDRSVLVLTADRVWTELGFDQLIECIR